MDLMCMLAERICAALPQVLNEAMLLPGAKELRERMEEPVLSLCQQTLAKLEYRV